MNSQKLLRHEPPFDREDPPHRSSKASLTLNSKSSTTFKIPLNLNSISGKTRENAVSTQSFRVTSMSKSKKNEEDSDALTRASFQFHMVVGKGGFGKVWIVSFRNSKKFYALKEMCKRKIISKKSVHSVMNEKQILVSLSHTFIVNIKSSFQDRRFLYLLMDLVTGGDLRFHLCYMRSFSEEQTRFFIACILVALEYIHAQGYLHRDVKPENLIFDERGYLRITDFGISRRWNPDNARETSGTPGYMSPEVMCRMQHSFESDYYAVGVICYECITGKRPYDGKNRKEIRDQILARQRLLRVEELPKGWSSDAIDFVNRLIARKPHKRLGYNGISEIINHPWFKGFSWEKLRRKELEPPFVPNVREVFDYLRSISEDSTHNTEVAEVDLDQKATLELFSGYAFNNSESFVRRTEKERIDKEKTQPTLEKASVSACSNLIKPIKFSQSPMRQTRVLNRNHLSVNLLNINPTSIQNLTSKDRSLVKQKVVSHNRSSKENFVKEVKIEGNLSHRPSEMGTHSRIRAASNNLPLTNGKWTSCYKY